MLRRIETVDNIPDFLEGVKNRDEKLMGFGHRVYKNYDPRARIIKKHVDEVLEITGENPLLDIATELEKRALDDDFFTERKLYPNVDFYSGLIYEALRIPTDMFTVIFAIPRTSGWVSQWMEMTLDPEKKIARPRQIYTGKRDEDYVPIEDRDGPEKITGPPARRPKLIRRGACKARWREALGAMSAWKVTMRHGPQVSRGGVRHARRRPGRGARGRVDRTRREGRLATINALREFTPDKRVQCRVEVSGKGFLRGPEAGIDVMGDGTIVPYTGAIRKRQLEADTLDEAIEAIRCELGG